MPNWCSNTITIYGDEKKLKLISRVLSDDTPTEQGVFEKLVGRNPSLSEQEYNQGGWWEGNIGYWGTKWDVSVDDSCPIINEDSIVISPATAWSPPIGFCEQLSKKYGVSIDMFYSEPGNDFCGKCSFDNEGNKISETDYTYQEGYYILDNEYFWDNLSFDLDCMIENGEDKLKDIKERFDYVSKEDLKEIIKMFKEQKKEYDKN